MVNQITKGGMVTTANKNRSGDIDVDVANRTEVLKHFNHVNASKIVDGKITAHNTGAYFTAIPSTVGNLSTIDYKDAEERGYFKIDVLNVNVYSQVRDEMHLVSLMLAEPPWHRLLEKEFCEKLVHVGNYHSMICGLPEPIDSIPRLAMFLAMIRPGKKHLIGKPWKEVAQTIWDKTDEGYTFKRSHSVSYSHLIVVQMNLLAEQENATSV